MSLEQDVTEKMHFAPIYKIPDDVLRLIFEEVYLRYSGSSPPYCSLIPTHVSHRWRQVAITLPTIWTYIRAALHEDLLRLWIERSGRLPLYLFFEAHTRLSETRLRMLLMHAPRWKSIQVELSRPDLIRDFLCAYQHQKLIFPMLEYIDIRHEGTPFALGTMQSYPSCPNLRHYTLTALHLPFDHPTNLFHLQSVHIRRCSIHSSELLSLSIAAPQLGSLTFENVDEAFSRDLKKHTAIFRSLKTLRFILSDPEDLLHAIEAPSLQSFIHSRGLLWTRGAPPSRVYPSVTHMRLEKCTLSGSGAYRGQIFHIAPRLAFLELIDCNEIIPVFGGVRFGSSNNSDLFLPTLQTLTLTNTRDECLQHLVDFMLRRHKSSSPFRELRLGDKSANSLGQEAVRALSRLGMFSIFPEEQDERERERMP